MGVTKAQAKSDVCGQILGDAPVILNVRTKQFPPAARGCSFKRLVVNRSSNLPYEQISGSISCIAAKQQKIPILESVGDDVHLIGSDSAANAKGMITPCCVPRIRQ